MDALGIEQRRRRRLRLGRANRQHPRRAVARASPRARLGERLPDRQPRGERASAAAGRRARLVVPVLLRHRARPRRLRAVPRRVRPADLAHRVAALGLRRRDVRSQRGILRQPRPRRHRHPQLPMAARPCRRRAPEYDDLERRLAERPTIAVPTITLEGDANGAPHPDAAAYRVAVRRCLRAPGRHRRRRAQPSAGGAAGVRRRGDRRRPGRAKRPRTLRTQEDPLMSDEQARAA